MNDISTTINEYIAAWNEGDESRRRELVSRTFADDATYLDPLVSSEGTDGIATMIGAVQQQFPGFRFRLAGPVDGHHNQARFGWELGPDGAPAPIVGFDVAVSDDSGRIQTVLGFLDKVPAPA